MMKKAHQILVGTTLAVGALALTGCGGDAAAQEVFTIAYLPGESTNHNADARQGMAQGLSEALGMPVEEFHAEDHASVIEAMRLGLVDMASLGPLTFAQAVQRADAEAVAIRAMYGDPELAIYHTLFLVRPESDIQSIYDFPGRTIAFVDPNSTSGNLVPVNELINAFPEKNLTQDDLHANGPFFSSSTFSGSHDAGLAALLLGDVDIVPIADTILFMAIANGHVDESEFRVVHQSPPIPSEPFAVRGGLDPEVVETVREFMLGLEDEDFFAGVLGDPNFRFIPATVEDFAPVIALMDLLN